MNSKEIKTILARCDELTENGQVLSIDWEGGSDSGWIFLRLDGIEQENYEQDQLLLNYVGHHLGYGSFAGDFSCHGTVVYNREKKCFVGEDIYSSTDQGLANCLLEFFIPKEVWFDSIVIRVESDGSHLGMACSAQLEIANGPNPEHFEPKRMELESMLQEKFAEVRDGIPDFEAVWEVYNIPRKNFEEIEGQLRYQICEMEYSFEKILLTPINLPLSDHVHPTLDFTGSN